jgi:uncharacterized protein
MRRKDREITDFNEILAIMEKCDVCRLAMVDNSLPYVVPMNFGFTAENGKVTMYFHSAKEGRKIDILKVNPDVCIEMDCSHQLITGEKACDYTMDFESIIGSGKAEFIDSEEEKKFALTQIMRKYSDTKPFNFDEKLLRYTTLIIVRVSELAGKRHKTLE